MKKLWASRLERFLYFWHRQCPLDKIKYWNLISNHKWCRALPSSAIVCIQLEITRCWFNFANITKHSEFADHLWKVHCKTVLQKKKSGDVPAHLLEKALWRSSSGWRASGARGSHARKKFRSRESKKGSRDAADDELRRWQADRGAHVRTGRRPLLPTSTSPRGAIQAFCTSCLIMAIYKVPCNIWCKYAFIGRPTRACT